MKKISPMLYLLGIVLFLFSYACAPKNDTSLPSSTSVVPLETVTTDVPATEPPTSETTSIDGDALIREKLENHHSIDKIYNAIKTREEWNATLDRMIGYGAKISDEEKQIIIDYLMSRQ